MGPRQEAQPALLYAFSLEDHVAQDHLLRSIDRFVDLDGIRAHHAEIDCHTGHPSAIPNCCANCSREPSRRIADGLVSGQRFATKASLIEADANKHASTPKKVWDAAAVTPDDARVPCENISKFLMMKWSCFSEQIYGFAKKHLVCVHAAFCVSARVKCAVSGDRLSSAV